MEGRLTVIAAVIRKDGRILIARRKKGDRFEGLWEFPGGKLEDGETPEACLKREIKEELNVEVKVGNRIGVTRYACASYEVELLAFHAFHESGVFSLRDHEEIRWVSPAELDAFKFTWPDIPIAAKLRKTGHDRPAANHHETQRRHSS